MSQNSLNRHDIIILLFFSQLIYSRTIKGIKNDIYKNRQLYRLCKNYIALTLFINPIDKRHKRTEQDIGQFRAKIDREHAEDRTNRHGRRIYTYIHRGYRSLVRTRLQVSLQLTSNSGNQLIATRAACARLAASHVTSRDSQSSFNRTPVKRVASYLSTYRICVRRNNIFIAAPPGVCARRSRIVFDSHRYGLYFQTGDIAISGRTNVYGTAACFSRVPG